MPGGTLLPVVLGTNSNKFNDSTGLAGFALYPVRLSRCEHLREPHLQDPATTIFCSRKISVAEPIPSTKPSKKDLPGGPFYLVGVTGLEPATSRPPAVRATNCATPRYYQILLEADHILQGLRSRFKVNKFSLDLDPASTYYKHSL